MKKLKDEIKNDIQKSYLSNMPFDLPLQLSTYAKLKKEINNRLKEREEFNNRLKEWREKNEK